MVFDLNLHHESQSLTSSCLLSDLHRQSQGPKVTLSGNNQARETPIIYTPIRSTQRQHQPTQFQQRQKTMTHIETEKGQQRSHPPDEPLTVRSILSRDQTSSEQMSATPPTAYAKEPASQAVNYTQAGTRNTIHVKSSKDTGTTTTRNNTGLLPVVKNQNANVLDRSGVILETNLRTGQTRNGEQ